MTTPAERAAQPPNALFPKWPPAGWWSRYDRPADDSIPEALAWLDRTAEFVGQLQQVENDRLNGCPLPPIDCACLLNDARLLLRHLTGVLYDDPALHAPGPVGPSLAQAALHRLRDRVSHCHAGENLEPLTELQAETLVTLHEMEAFDLDSRKTSREIAEHLAGGRQDSEMVKGYIRKLKQQGLVASVVKGSAGGYYLTNAGRRRAGELDDKGKNDPAHRRAPTTP